MSKNIKDTLKLIRESLKEYIDNQLKNYAKSSDIPTRTTQLINDSGYIKSIPSEYVTESELVTQMNNLSLGIHTDGLVYLFYNGTPRGSGLEVMTQEVVQGDVVGYIDENNVITLSGILDEGKYSIQYELENGTLVDLGTLNINANGGTDTPVEPNEPEQPDTPTVTYTNLLPKAVDENGNDFVGKNDGGGDGYEHFLRLNSSGQAVEGNLYLSGFIPISSTSDTIRIKNIEQYTTDKSYNRIAFYDKNKAFIGYTTLLDTNSAITVVDGVYTVIPKSFSLTSTNIGFFRFACGSISSNTIVTVNQEIVE